MLAENLSAHIPRDLVKAADQRVALETAQRDEELAVKVAEATFQMLKAKIDSDLDLLRKRIPTNEMQAAEAALDVKYIRDRQLSFGV